MNNRVEVDCGSGGEGVMGGGKGARMGKIGTTVTEQQLKKKKY